MGCNTMLSFRWLWIYQRNMLFFSTMKLKAPCSSIMLVSMFKAAWCPNPKDHEICLNIRFILCCILMSGWWLDKENEKVFLGDNKMGIKLYNFVFVKHCVLQIENDLHQSSLNWVRMSYHRSINPLAWTECSDSLPFSGASSIPPYHTLFPGTK